MYNGSKGREYVLYFLKCYDTKNGNGMKSLLRIYDNVGNDAVWDRVANVYNCIWSKYLKVIKGNNPNTKGLITA